MIWNTHDRGIEATSRQSQWHSFGRWQPSQGLTRHVVLRINFYISREKMHVTRNRLRLGVIQDGDRPRLNKVEAVARGKNYRTVKRRLPHMVGAIGWTCPQECHENPRCISWVLRLRMVLLTCKFETYRVLKYHDVR